MRSFVSHLPRPLLWSVWLAVLVISCGCRTTTQSLFTASGPGWHVQQGQALWRPQRGLPEFGGDLVLASDARRPLPHSIRQDAVVHGVRADHSDRWLIRFPQRQMGFTGHGPGPTRFAWLYLPAALDGKQLPSQLHFERKPDGGWRLENTRTGETLEGFLSP